MNSAAFNSVNAYRRNLKMHRMFPSTERPRRNLKTQEFLKSRGCRDAIVVVKLRF